MYKCQIVSHSMCGSIPCLLNPSTLGTIDKSYIITYNIVSTDMEYNTHNSQKDLLEVLFQPRMLFSLMLLWGALVAGGSGIAIFATQHSLMSDAEIEALLTENERLALTANVAYATDVQTPTIPTETIAVFPDRLTVPSLGIDLPISNPQTRSIEGLDEALNTSVVRYPDSATLGEENGNTLIFGHSSYLPIVRNHFFKAFNEIQDLQMGQAVIAYSGKDTYHYQVTNVYKASAADDRIPLQTAGHQITLLTCDSFGKKSDRWVVEAQYIGKNL